MNLLRGDEVCNIMWSHLQFDREEETVTLTLDFRKTHQLGGVKPFKHWVQPFKPELCVLMHLLKHIRSSGVTHGALFRRINKSGVSSQQLVIFFF